jgi:hypothetical protein
MPTAPNYKAVDTVTVRLTGILFSGNFRLMEYFFRVTIYSYHKTRLAVCQHFARPAVTTVLQALCCWKGYVNTACFTLA